MHCKNTRPASPIRRSRPALRIIGPLGTLALLTGAATASAAGSTPVAITPLPAAYYEVDIGNSPTSYTEPGDYAVGGEHVTTANTPSASVTTTVSGDGYARGYIKYSWQLNGPGNVSVPVIVTGDLRVSSAAPDNGQANAFAQLDWNSGAFSHTSSIEIDRGGFNNSSPTSAHAVFSEMVLTGSGGLVILQAGVNSGLGSGRAFADPIFSIDPAFAAVDPLYLQHYSFSFSPGIGNIAAVPEPSSGALMLAGAVVLGAMARRRRY